MKRTPLTRRTPLRSSGGIKPHRRARTRIADPTPAERAFVLARDGRCMVGDLSHDTARCDGPLTYGHARTTAGGARPRADDGYGRMFAIAECLRCNVDHREASTVMRARINDHLDRLYPDRRQWEQP